MNKIKKLRAINKNKKNQINLISSQLKEKLV